MRRLWHGETIFGHDGPAGRYPVLRLDPTFDEDIELGLVAFGPNSLALGGTGLRRRGPAHLLHRRDAAALRRHGEARRRTGRSRSRQRSRSGRASQRSATTCPRPLRLKKTVGRLATYLQGYGDLMVETNHWDPAVLARFRADEVVAGFRSAIDADATTEQLEHIADPDSRRVAGAVGDRQRRPVRRGRARPVRPRRRRRDHARRIARRARPGRRRLRQLTRRTLAGPSHPPPRKMRDWSLDARFLTFPAAPSLRNERRNVRSATESRIFWVGLVAG